MTIEHVDVLIVGAGISGIGAAWHLQSRLSGKSYAIIEARPRLGGTWDLFRYPGIRSDSDMHTLGFRFRPWREAKAIADGPSILRYLEATVREAGIDRHIRFNQRLTRATWSSLEARWLVDVSCADSGATRHYSCNFLYMCAGYYSYRQGIAPHFDGQESFAGTIVHPQFWPEGLDYSGKRVVVIGSGATAMTLVPAMTDKAAHVTMLQRSPTYVISRPAKDAIANGLRRILPASWAYALTRWKNVIMQQIFFKSARSQPQKIKAQLLDEVRAALGPDYDVEKHFTPRYNPWEQRLCLIPDADLFTALKSGRASVVTDHIDHFTPQGIMLKSGTELPADIIVTATGLKLAIADNMTLCVDGKMVHWPEKISYKAIMFSDIPNFVSTFGYTNASWTLKADLTAEYVCRLLKHMDKVGARQATPRLNNPNMPTKPWLDFSSTYVVNEMARMPKQGVDKPWRLDQSYFRDLMNLRFGKLDDGVMEFTNPKSHVMPQSSLERSAA